MKVFKKSALVLAMTMSAGMVHAAGSIDIVNAGSAVADVNGADQDFADATANGVDGTGPVFLDSLIAGSSVSIDLDVAGAGAAQVTKAREIIYTPNTVVGENSTITFEVENGAIDDAEGVQLSDDAVGTNVMAALVDFQTNANGYTSMRFQVESGVSLTAGTAYFMTTSANGAGTEESPVVVTDAGLATGANVTLEAVSAQDPSAIPISQGVAPAETLVTVVNGTVVALDDVTSTIDVEANPSRALFRTSLADEGETAGISAAQGEAETDTHLSRASVDISLGAEVGPDLTGDNWTMTLTRSNLDGVAGVNLVTDPAGAAVTTPFTLDNGSYVINGVGNAEDLEGTHNIDILVNGTDVLATGEWLASLTANDTGGVGNVTIADEAVSHTWDINGAQFKIPYHAQNASGFVFFFKAVNETNNDAAIAADVIVENTTQGTRETVNGVSLGNAIAQGNTTVGQQAIKDAIIAAGGTMNDSDVYHVHMQLTVNAPQNDIQVAAFQKDAAGRTSVPVYINSNNTNDGRRWQQ